MELTEWQLKVAKAHLHYPVRIYFMGEDDNKYKYQIYCDGNLHNIDEKIIELCNGGFITLENGSVIRINHLPERAIEMKNVIDIKIYSGGRVVDGENRGLWWQPITKRADWIAKRNLEDIKREFGGAR